MKGALKKTAGQLLALMALCCCNFSLLYAQCDLSDDFSSSKGWTQVGTNVGISNGRIEYTNGASCGQQRRVYRSLGKTLKSDDTWQIDIDFHPTSVGSYGRTRPMTGHLIVALTAGTKDPMSDCPDIPCTGRPPSKQDAISIMYATDNPPNGKIFFRAHARDGSDRASSASVFTNAMNTTFYLRLERTSATKVRMSICSDAKRTKHLSGSPVDFTVAKTLEGFTTVQSATSSTGWQIRELNGWADNLCIQYADCSLNPVVADAGDDEWICEGDSVQLSASGGKFYRWFPTQYFGNNTREKVWVSPEKNTEFLLRAIDERGCSDTDTVVVKVHPPPKANAGRDTFICLGDTATLSGSGGLSYSWGPAYLIQEPTRAIIKTSPKKDQEFVLRVTDANGCVATDNILVKVFRAEIGGISGSGHYCLNDSVTLSSINGIAFSWWGSLQGSLGTGKSIRIKVRDDEAIGLRVTDLKGCRDSVLDSIKISVPQAILGKDTSVCAGDTVWMRAAGGISYDWLPKSIVLDETKNMALVKATEGVELSVIVTDTIGCRDTATQQLHTLKLPTLKAWPDTSICRGDSVLLKAESNATRFKWWPGKGLRSRNSAGVWAVPSDTTRYFVQVEDAHSCISTTSVTIDIKPGAIADFDLPNPLELYVPDFKLVNRSTGATDYYWQFWDDHTDSVEHPTVHFKADSSYKITLIAYNHQTSCHDTISKQTLFRFKPPFLIPNIFSPNDDGFNDFFVIQDLSSDASLQIYNRWGQVVYTSGNYSNDWQGVAENGKKLAVGVYYYSLQLADGQEYIGSLSLVR